MILFAQFSFFVPCSLVIILYSRSIKKETVHVLGLQRRSLLASNQLQNRYVKYDGDKTAIPMGSTVLHFGKFWSIKLIFFPVWFVRTNYLELTEVELQSDRIFCNNRKQLLCIDMHGLYCVFTSVILLSINVLTLIRFLSRTAHQLSSYN